GRPGRRARQSAGGRHRAQAGGGGDEGGRGGGALVGARARSLGRTGLLQGGGRARRYSKLSSKIRGASTGMAISVRLSPVASVWSALASTRNAADSASKAASTSRLKASTALASGASVPIAQVTSRSTVVQPPW